MTPALPRKRHPEGPKLVGQVTPASRGGKLIGSEQEFVMTQ